MAQRIAVIGLGRMGAAMARRLVARGFVVRGYDVNPAAVTALETVDAAPTLRDAWHDVDVALLSLPLPEHVEAVLLDLLAATRAPLRVIDTSTSDPDTTRRLHARLAAVGHGLIDAPVSGGPAGAAAGTLAMMLGGAGADIDAVRPVLDALGDKLTHVGDAGAGHTAKLVNNVLCAAQLLLAGEALRMGAAAGPPLEALTSAVNGASGRSGVSEVNVPRWIASGSFDSGFTMALMEKDLTLAARLARQTGLALPLIEMVVERWRTCRGAHGPEADFNRAFLGAEA